MDTSVILDIMEGLIHTQRKSVDTIGWKAKYDKIINLLQLLKIYNNWGRYFFTPHILTETCSHINKDYNDGKDFEDIVKNIMYIVRLSQEKNVSKKEFIDCINYCPNMDLEPGDLSIYVTADCFAQQKEKISILTIDDGFIKRYGASPYVMVINYKLVDIK